MFKALKGWLSVAAVPFTNPFDIMRPMPLSLALPPAAIARLTVAPLPLPGAAFVADTRIADLKQQNVELKADRTMLTQVAGEWRGRYMRANDDRSRLMAEMSRMVWRLRRKAATRESEMG